MPIRFPSVAPVLHLPQSNLLRPQFSEGPKYSKTPFAFQHSLISSISHSNPPSYRSVTTRFSLEPHGPHDLEIRTNCFTVPEFMINAGLKFSNVPIPSYSPLNVSKSHSYPPPNRSVIARFSLDPECEPTDLEIRTSCYAVGKFMIKKDDMVVVKPTTTIVEAMKMLVEHKINGFPVIDDDWKLIGVVSDYDLLASGTASLGSWLGDTSLFPEVDSPWKKFKEMRKLQSMSGYQVVGDLMTETPLPVVQESTCLEDVASLLLRTKHRRLPVVDLEGKLVGMVTRGSVVKAAILMSKPNKTK